MLSNTSLACLSSAKFNVTNLKSRPLIRIEEERPEAGGVGRKVQKAIIGYAIHDSLVLTGIGVGGGFPSRGDGGARV